MGRCRTWIGWLSLAAGVFWVGGAAVAQDLAAQHRMAAKVPLNEIPENVRDRVRQVTEHPTLYGRGPAEAFTGQPSLYDWLLDHPVHGVKAWRRLGAKCTEITDRGDGRFGWTDTHGGEITWQTIHSTPSMRIWYAEGKFRPGLFLPPVPVQMVLILRHGSREDKGARTLLFHQAHAFLLTDSKAANLAARMLGASGLKLAEQYLAQMETFFSGLVWYFDQHPERQEKLLKIH